MWFAQFDEFLRASSDGRVSLDKHILPQIERLCVHSLLAAKDQMECAAGCGYRSFHLFGYDFMVDVE